MVVEQDTNTINININKRKLKIIIKWFIISFVVVGAFVGGGFLTRFLVIHCNQKANEKGELIIYDIALRPTCNEYSELYFKAKANHDRCKIDWIHIANASVPLGVDPRFDYYWGYVSETVPMCPNGYTRENGSYYYEFSIGVWNVPMCEELLIILKYNRISDNAKMYLCVKTPDIWFYGW